MELYIHYNLHGGTPDAHNEIKTTMLGLRYFDFYITDGVRYNLPNASLWCNNESNLQKPINDLNMIVNLINSTRDVSEKIIIIRCLVLTFDQRLAIPNEPNSP